MDKSSREYVVCLCDKVTRGEIEDIAKEKGIAEMQEFCNVTGIGKRCGGCREDIQMILDDIASGKC